MIRGDRPGTPRRRWRIAVALLLVLGMGHTTAFAQTSGPVTRNVVLVTIDGLRWEEVFGGADRALLDGLGNGAEADRARGFWRDTQEERRAVLLPFLWSAVAAEGQLWGNAWLGSRALVTNGRLFSYPGYNEMLAGRADDRIDSNAKRPNPNVTVLEWLNRRPEFEGRVAAFCSWDVFPYIINEERSGVYVNAGWEPLDDTPLTERQHLLNELSVSTPHEWDNVRYDGFTFSAALEYLGKHEPRLLFISLDAPDSRAHEGRYDLYLLAAHRFDRLLAELWQAVESIPGYRGTTTLVVTTDHGRGDGEPAWRGHGSNVEGAERIWVGFLGPDTPPLGEMRGGEPITQSQIAATVAALLGEDFRAGAPEAAPPIGAALTPP